MGARQSKRSMDVTTGKEVIVEGSEVAASGGEGKLERIEDVDSLKPQLNGTAEHQEDVVISVRCVFILFASCMRTSCERFGERFYFCATRRIRKNR